LGLEDGTGKGTIQPSLQEVNMKSQTWGESPKKKHKKKREKPNTKESERNSKKVKRNQKEYKLLKEEVGGLGHLVRV
jgi:hypothetical protein